MLYFWHKNIIFQIFLSEQVFLKTQKPAKIHIAVLLKSSIIKRLFLSHDLPYFTVFSMTSTYQHSSKITEKHFPTSKYHLIELKDEKKPKMWHMNI